MELPKFVIGDNTDFPDDIFVIHLEYPRFFINLKDDSVEFLEDIEETSRKVSCFCENRLIFLLNLQNKKRMLS